MSDSDKGIELQERSSEERFTEIEVKPENGVTNPSFEEPSVQKVHKNEDYSTHSVTIARLRNPKVFSLW